MFFTLLAISGFFRIIRPQEVQKGLVAGFTVVIFTFFYGIGAGSVPFTFSTEVFPLTYRVGLMMQVPDIESVEVGMSFSVMVNFLGLSLLVLFVPRLTTILSPNGPSARKARLLGQSNLLFLFSGLNALAFVLVFFLVPSGTAQISLEEMNAICMDCSWLPLSCSIQRPLCMHLSISLPL
ncbi:hypothetical protein AFUB_045720 [Aspergillus fumigatus A1163]|uniref:Uncharacterized protein n=1 Tax=Aspergillus fumigatus (strain CBS 144.89 / FGSC A1163 / CEA10) TaxID=451804 RepID=B0Y059_ASPFC|nr:hypothetical protein AFUB_045720 [Aspergillus fumigatus A1163]